MILGLLCRLAVRVVLSASARLARTAALRFITASKAVCLIGIAYCLVPSFIPSRPKVSV